MSFLHDIPVRQRHGSPERAAGGIASKLGLKYSYGTAMGG